MSQIKTITVSWFSAGVSSAVATWLMRDKIDHIIYCHIDDQHEDTMRFVKDCEQWFGKPIEILQSPYKNVEAVCRATRWINGPHGAQCTALLKKRIRKEWESEHEWFCRFRYVWGMDVTETKPRPPMKLSRVDGIIKDMPNISHEFPLVDLNFTKEQAHGVLEHHGINRPFMYELGYRNNNCVGCVKGGMWYWNRIRKHFPQVFESRAKMERDIGASCINGTFLDELDPTSGREEDEVMPECGAACQSL